MPLLFDLLARGVVGADQQVADDGVLRVAQRRDRHHRREPAAVLADVGQLVDVLDAARGLEHQRLEARRDRRAELDAQRAGARDHFLRIGDVGRRDLVHHLGGGVAEHPLGADVEDLDDALGVGGDAREVGAVEDRALQRARFQQRFGVSNLNVEVECFSRTRVLEWHVFQPAVKRSKFQASASSAYRGGVGRESGEGGAKGSRYTRRRAGGVSD